MLLNIFSYSAFLIIHSGLPASVYGFGENNCGDSHSARTCADGATTASGEVFNPQLATAAIPIKGDRVLRPFDIWLRVDGGVCSIIRVNDKLNPRYKLKRSFDLTPGALKKLGVKPNKYWSGNVFKC